MTPWFPCTLSVPSADADVRRRWKETELELQAVRRRVSVSTEFYRTQQIFKVL